MAVDEAIIAARIITGAVDLPVSVDFENGYAPDAAGVTRDVRRLIEESDAVGINIEDSIGAAKAPQFDISGHRRRCDLLPRRRGQGQALDQVNGRLSVIGKPGTVRWLAWPNSACPG